MKKLSRLLAVVLASMIALMPGESWAPTQVFPAGNGVATSSPSSSGTTFGQQFYISPQTPGFAQCAFFTGDVAMEGFTAATGTSFNTNHSPNGGATWDAGVTVTGFAASTFGEMMQCIKLTNGLYIFAMANSTGGFATSFNPSSGPTSFNSGPCTAANTTGNVVGQGPNGTVLVGLNNGTWCRSTNGGLTWTNYPTPGFSNPYTGSLHSPSAGVWIAGFGNGGNGQIGRSTDDGQTFTVVNTPAGGLNGLVCLSSTVCLAATGGAGGGAVLRSTDAGVNWTSVATFGTAGWGNGNNLRQPNGMCFANFGSGIVVGLRALSGATVGLSPGWRSADSGVTWQPLPNLTGIYGGTNPEGIINCTTRGGRAWAFNATLENVVVGVYSPGIAQGNVVVADPNGNQLLFQQNATTLQQQVPVFQGEGAVDGRIAPWAVNPVQRPTILNSSTTGAANTAVTVTLAATANQRSHIYSIEAYCSAGAGAADLTITDVAAVVFRIAAAGIPAAPAVARREWPVGLTNILVNSNLVIVAPACGVGNTTTLNVQADRY